MTRHHAGLWRWLERGLFAFGFACLAWSAFVIGEGAWWQREQRRALAQALNTLPPGHAELDPGPLPVRPGDPIGQLEVPRLHLSAVIIEGDDEASLRVAVGHLPDTPLPWQSGNSALAAHRDTYFRPLKDIKPGDVLRLATRRGTLEYRVRDTMIVDPEDVWVLDPTENPTLTLITCHPFSYVGHAPHRFIVRAERVDGRRPGRNLPTSAMNRGQTEGAESIGSMPAQNSAADRRPEPTWLGPDDHGPRDSRRLTFARRLRKHAAPGALCIRTPARGAGRGRRRLGHRARDLEGLVTIAAGELVNWHRRPPAGDELEPMFDCA
jgi:sortase A